MQAIPVSKFVHEPTHNHFWSCIRRLDSLHNPASASTAYRHSLLTLQRPILTLLARDANRDQLASLAQKREPTGYAPSEYDAPPILRPLDHPQLEALVDVRLRQYRAGCTGPA
jgi:hypothetical protein